MAVVTAVEFFEHLLTVRGVVAGLTVGSVAVFIGMTKYTVQQRVSQVTLLQLRTGSVVAAGTVTVFDLPAIEHFTDVMYRVALHAAATVYERGVGFLVAFDTFGQITVLLLVTVVTAEIGVGAGIGHFSCRLFMTTGA